MAFPPGQGVQAPGTPYAAMLRQQLAHLPPEEQARAVALMQQDPMAQQLAAKQELDFKKELRGTETPGLITAGRVSAPNYGAIGSAMKQFAGFTGLKEAQDKMSSSTDTAREQKLLQQSIDFAETKRTEEAGNALKMSVAQSKLDSANARTTMQEEGRDARAAAAEAGRLSRASDKADLDREMKDLDIKSRKDLENIKQEARNSVRDEASATKMAADLESLEQVNQKVGTVFGHLDKYIMPGSYVDEDGRAHFEYRPGVKNIPGVGVGEGQRGVLGQAIRYGEDALGMSGGKSEGQDVFASFAALQNDIIRNRAGLSQTLTETQNVLRALANEDLSSEEATINATIRLRHAYEQDLERISGKYNEGTRDVYFNRPGNEGKRELYEPVTSDQSSLTPEGEEPAAPASSRSGQSLKLNADGTIEVM